MKIELRIHDDDRKKLDIAGPEWLLLDTDWVRDQPAERLIRWETECGFAVERALAEIGSAMSAQGTLVLIWLARKQGGFMAGGRNDDGDPEPFAALAHIRTMRISARLVKAADADPPAEASSQEPSSPDGASATS